MSEMPPTYYAAFRFSRNHQTALCIGTNLGSSEVAERVGIAEIAVHLFHLQEVRCSSIGNSRRSSSGRNGSSCSLGLTTSNYTLKNNLIAINASKTFHFTRVA